MEELLDAVDRYRCSVGSGEEVCGVLWADLGAGMADVTDDVLPGDVRYRDRAHLLPFAKYADQVMLQVEVVELDVYQL